MKQEIIHKPKYNPNIMDVKRANWTKDEARFFGRLGGLRRTRAKKIAARLREAKQRTCSTCKYIEMCRVGQVQLATLKETNKDLYLEVKCKIPTTMLIIADKLQVGEYDELYDMMWFWLNLEANDFNKKRDMLQLLEKRLIQKNLNVNLNKIEKEVKLELVIMEKDKEVVIDEVKDNKVDEDTPEE